MSRKFDERVWYHVFQCPNCGYKTTVTNVCRHCPKTPADKPTRENLPFYCSTHKTFHQNGCGRYLIHHNIVMKKTEWASRFNPNKGRHERRKIKNLPKDAILK